MPIHAFHWRWFSNNKKSSDFKKHGILYVSNKFNNWIQKIDKIFLISQFQDQAIFKNSPNLLLSYSSNASVQAKIENHAAEHASQSSFFFCCPCMCARMKSPLHSNTKDVILLIKWLLTVSFDLSTLFMLA